MRFRRTLFALLVAAALTVAATGCGSDSDSTSPSTAAESPQSAPGETPEDATTTEESEGEPEQDFRESPPQRPDDGSGQEPAPASKPEEIARAQREEGESGDQSIQEFGSEADEEEEAEVVGAMRSFVTSMRDGDFEAVCDGLNAKMRQQMEVFLKAQKEQASAGGCPQLLRQLIPDPERKKAQRILDGVVTRVRIDGDNAFVLVKPPGEGVNYFVLTREEDKWGATSLAVGSPLVP
jgi:hypothetical protein